MIEMIEVLITNERGEPVSNAISVPAGIFPGLEDGRFTCLRFVDPYGDTTFNSLQLPSLLEDLRLLGESCNDIRAKETILQIQRLVETAQQDVHLYIKLIGD